LLSQTQSEFGGTAIFVGSSVRARTDGEIRRLTLPAFEVLAAKEPALARVVLFDLARILSLRLRQMMGRVRALG